MRFVSWNVNGLRACVQKGFLESFTQLNADFFCLQETKLQEGQIQLELPGYEQYWCYAEKKGYSGTAIFTRHTPMNVTCGIGVAELDTEGRVITLEYPEFYLVTCYTPNAQRELARIDHRMKWEEAFRTYLCGLDQIKPVILCGDLNVAHKEIDLKNPASNRGNAGFSDEERECFSQLLDSGFTDTFRYLHPNETGAYTWWSYMFQARQKNAGWRIDYFLVSDRLRERIHGACIHPQILGSDHCPVELDLEVPCNGGIWWSSENGAEEAAAQILPEKSTSKSGGLKAAAAVFAAVAVAAGIFFSLWRPQTPEPFVDDNYFTVEMPSAEFKVTVYDHLPEFQWTVSDLLNAYFQYYITDAGNRYQLGAPDQTQTGGKYNFFLQVFAPEDQEYIADVAATLEAHPHDNAHLSRPASLLQVVRWYYGDGKFGGWFVLGLLNRPEKLTLTLQQYDASSAIGNILVTRHHLDAFPLLAEGEAPKQPAAWLVDYLLHHPDLYSAIRDKSSKEEVLAAFETFCKGDHILQAAYNVSALPSYLSTYTTSAENCSSCARILRNALLKEVILDPGGLLPPTEAEPDIDILPETDYWILRAINEVELSAYSGKTLEEAYAAAKQDHPYLQELENAEDAAGRLLGYYTSGDVIPFLLFQPEYLLKMDAHQMDILVYQLTQDKGPASLTTEQLAHLVSCYRPMYEEMMFASSTVVTERIYEVFKGITLMISVLESRSDAIEALLSEAKICSNSRQMLNIRTLLSLETYQSRMTQQQRAQRNEIFSKLFDEVVPE